jgi:hypothetical protein
VSEEYEKVVTLLLDAKESLREAHALADEVGLPADFEGVINTLDNFTYSLQMLLEIWPSPTMLAQSDAESDEQ